ncbi:hypothetical protein KL86DPRO_20209 [uncultured delta proteobacterium]|uniref:Uncharacterized protein n=1 Tax=uncultured delta proteobacterium TaxID=34034 RepID=A0A212JWH6_9DELT|nr:hypothetical protein KL86DPRO_20209 [uncultured delta proteobacterium]
MPESMHIVFTLTRDYLPYAAVTLASVRHHLREGDEAVFHILHGGDIGPADEAEFLGKLPSGTAANQVRFTRVEDHFDVAGRARYLPIRTPAAYYRLYIPELFPHLDRLLYLDADLVACRDLRELYDLDMTGVALAGVEDYYGKTLAQCLFLLEDAVYLNGGVLLWNLREIDRANWWERVDFFLSGNHKYVMNGSDQDVLALLLQEKMKRLDPCWNVQVRELEDRRNITAVCGVHNSMTPENCRRAFRTPGIAHYVEGSKPWSATPPASHPDPLRKRWFFYAKMTGYYGEAWKAYETQKFPARQRASQLAAWPVSEPAFPWNEAVKAALKNNLLRQLNEQEREKEFSLDELATKPDRRLLSPHPREVIRGAGPLGLFGLLFHTACIDALRQPDDLDGAEGFVQHVFRDNWKLEEHVCLNAAAIEGRLDGYFAEIAFLTSVLHVTDDFTIPLKYRRAYGFIVDDRGFYFDAFLPGSLERYLHSESSALDAQEAARCRAAMRYIVENKLTKYNFPTLHTPALLREPDRKVLVVDQSYGDASITRGLAEPHSFAAMLEAAVRENPEATVIVKTHPDTATGLSAGYYDTLSEGGRIRKLTEVVNPHVIFPYVDKVYVCTSQLGFEALMAGKPVVTFGMPIYAGWGLTDDRAHCPRQTRKRTRKLSLEELFYGLYIRFCAYFNPYAPEPCTLEEFMAHLVRLRAEYWDFAARRKP